uniref:Sm domain-containing protein n=1 Tax=Trichuris muris TaxID=70415 RepID=A0A5S6QSG8_TRIMR
MGHCSFPSVYRTYLHSQYTLSTVCFYVSIPPGTLGSIDSLKRFCANRMDSIACGYRQLTDQKCKQSSLPQTSKNNKSSAGGYHLKEPSEFFQLLMPSVGKRCIVEMINDTKVHGVVEKIDGKLNITLSDATVIKENGSYEKRELHFVCGRSLRYVLQTEDYSNFLKQPGKKIGKFGNSRLSRKNRLEANMRKVEERRENTKRENK